MLKSYPLKSSPKTTPNSISMGHVKYNFNKILVVVTDNLRLPFYFFCSYLDRTCIYVSLIDTSMMCSMSPIRAILFHLAHWTERFFVIAKKIKLCQTSKKESLWWKHIPIVPENSTRNTEKLTMLKTSNCSEVSIIGSVNARFFCTSKLIDTYCSEWKTKLLSGVVIVWNGTETVHHIEQWCYFCNISGFGQVHKIVLHHFKVNQPPAVILEAEHCPTDAQGEVPVDNISFENQQYFQKYGTKHHCWPLDKWGYH